MRRVSKAFFRGYIRVLDLKGTKKWPDISDGRTKDYEALRGDWEYVGKEIRKETRSYKRVGR